MPGVVNPLNVRAPTNTSGTIASGRDANERAIAAPIEPKRARRTG